MLKNFRYSRFEDIYPNRESAIKILNNTTRDYGETVAIRYKYNLNTEVILALYMSDTKGDYLIHFDSKNGTDGDDRNFSITKLNDSESDTESINRAYLGASEPLTGDIVFITTLEGQKAIYIRDNDGNWLPLLKVIEGSETDSLMITVDDSDGLIKISGTVKRINGGNLKDLL
jgi:hypothetical protein